MPYALWLAPLSLISFVAFWCLMVVLLSLLSGWHSLARRYASQHADEVGTIGFQSASFGLASYRFCLTIGATADGLTLPLFRPGHPTLAIPWPDLRYERRQFLSLSFDTLMVAGPWPTTIRFYRGLPPELLNAWPQPAAGNPAGDAASVYSREPAARCKQRSTSH